MPEDKDDPYRLPPMKTPPPDSSSDLPAQTPSPAPPEIPRQAEAASPPPQPMGAVTPPLQPRGMHPTPPQHAPAYTPAPAAPDGGALKVIAVLHFIMGGLTCLLSIFFFFNLSMGLALITNSNPHIPTSSGGPSAQDIGWIFLAFGVVIIAIILGLGALQMYVAYSFYTGHHYYLCLVYSILELVFLPFGTLLGIVALLVLNMEDSKRYFAANSSQSIRF